MTIAGIGVWAGAYQSVCAHAWVGRCRLLLGAGAWEMLLGHGSSHSA